MAFTPPRCPNTGCPFHREPPTDRRFYRRRGSFVPKCRGVPVPRFHCNGCHKSFSRQTFRADYRDHRPDLNAQLFSLLTSGIGLRQSARMLMLSRRCTEMKFRKMARHLARLHPNLTGQFVARASFLLDEMETFEGSRRARPLTLPVLIESASMFIVDACCAPIRPSGRMTPKRRAAIRHCQKRYGQRTNRSVHALRRVLRAAARHCQDLPVVALTSDEKIIYPKLAQEAFGHHGQRHLRCCTRYHQALVHRQSEL